MVGTMKRSADLLILFVLGLLLSAGCVKDRTWKTGESAPEISVLDLNEHIVRLSDFRGKAVVVRFWSAGCKACLAEMPMIDVFYKRNKDKGLAVLAVNRGESKERVERFVTNLNISYPVLLDPEAIASKNYGVTAVPTTYFIDKKGIARKVIPGPISQDLFEKAVFELLDENHG